MTDQILKLVYLYSILDLLKSSFVIEFFYVHSLRTVGVKKNVNKLEIEAKICRNRWRNRMIEAFHICWYRLWNLEAGQGLSLTQN